MSAQPKPVDWDALVRLFRPGSGVMPPELAGREDELKTLNRFRADLAEKRPTPSDAILYGPRGNGKTVLLDAFLAECRAAGTAARSLDASEIETPEALARELLAAHPADPQGGAGGKLAHAARQAQDLPGARDLEMKHVEAGVKGGMPGVVEGGVHMTLERIPPERLAEVLRGRLAERCAKKPLAVLVDEAHTLDLEAGRRLLNLSQHLRRERVPFFLVMAGTPGLEAQMRKMDASFWERSERLGIGRLDKQEEARAALAVPLKKRGVDCDASALAEAVEESQRYPYFLQLWGQALCRALDERKATRVTAEIVEAARPAFEARRTFYYEHRCKELLKSGLLPAAEAAAGGFAEARAEKRKWTLRDAARRLRADLGLRSEAEAAAEMERLSHLGLVWQPPGSEHLEAGIPSLMDHVLQNAAAPGPGIGEGPGASPAWARLGARRPRSGRRGRMGLVPKNPFSP